MSDSLYLLLGILVSLLFVAFFSGVEIAFNTANRLSIELRKKQGKISAIIMSGFMEHPSRFLSSCLIGLNLFTTLYGVMFSELMKTSLWKPVFNTDNEYVKLGIDTIVASLLILFVGEFMPRAIFRAKSDGLLAFFAPLAKFFYNIFNPIAAVFVNFSETMLKYLFNVRIKTSDEYFSTTDLEHLMQQNNEQDDTGQDLNRELLQNALSLPGIKIRQCLVPRTEVEAVELHTPIENVYKKFEETKLSKLIVYEGNIDNILGYVHQLDMFKQPASLSAILLPIVVVPETMSATDLINKFSKERKSIAWVVDEFGGTAGIITMEDLVEEIFGEIHDEYDTEEFTEHRISDTEYQFSGRLELDYLSEKYELDFPPEHASETLSGYIITEHETIPKPKEKIIIDRYEFEIMQVSDTRIEMVKIRVLR